MTMDRRTFLQVLLGSGAMSMLPRISFAAPKPGEPFWVHVQATGAWDVALSCDPQPALRQGLNRTLYVYGAPIIGQNGMPTRGQGDILAKNSTEVRQTPGGGIRYMGFADFHWDPQNPAHPYKPFFPTYYDRTTVFNGIDTGTINHDTGIRFCASGSLNEGSPCFATQVAAALGPDRTLPFVNLGGYDETAGMIAAVPMTGSAVANLLKLVAPNDRSGDNLGTDTVYEAGPFDLVRKAHARRLARQRDKARLPGHRGAIDRMITAEAGQDALASLRFSGNDQSQQNLMRVAIDAFRQGLAASMNVPVGGFDAAHGDNEQAQAYALFALFEQVKFILQETEAPTNGKDPVPCVIVVTSDFGRSPYYRNAGTDHWPVTSMMVVQNKQALALGLAIPTNRTIGASTAGGEDVALRPRKIDPVRLVPDDTGVTLTPGHVVRALRRLAKIDQSPRLASWPLMVDRDLAIG